MVWITAIRFLFYPSTTKEIAMGIRVRLNTTFVTRSGLLVEILGKVSNEFVGRHQYVKTGATTEKVFVPVPFYRAKFKDTQEVVFYSDHGNIISEKVSSVDGPLALVKEVA